MSNGRLRIQLHLIREDRAGHRKFGAGSVFALTHLSDMMLSVELKTEPADEIKLGLSCRSALLRYSTIFA